MSHRFTSEDCGNLFEKDGKVYVVEWYCPEPMVALRQIHPTWRDIPPEKIESGVSGLNAQGFRPLVPLEAP